MAEASGLSLDSAVNGTIQLSYPPPPGITAPAGDPTTAMMSAGQANFSPHAAITSQCQRTRRERWLGHHRRRHHARHRAGSVTCLAAHAARPAGSHPSRELRGGDVHAVLGRMGV